MPPPPAEAPAIGNLIWSAGGTYERAAGAVAPEPLGALAEDFSRRATSATGAGALPVRSLAATRSGDESGANAYARAREPRFVDFATRAPGAGATWTAGCCDWNVSGPNTGLNGPGAAPFAGDDSVAGGNDSVAPICVEVGPVAAGDVVAGDVKTSGVEASGVGGADVVVGGVVAGGVAAVDVAAVDVAAVDVVAVDVVADGAPGPAAPVALGAVSVFFADDCSVVARLVVDDPVAVESLEPGPSGADATADEFWAATLDASVGVETG